MIVKKNSTTNAQTFFHGVQLSGSLEDDEGIGKRSVRPSEVMRKILPVRTEDIRVRGWKAWFLQ
jgi:hypothetical protein